MDSTKNKGKIQMKENIKNGENIKEIIVEDTVDNEDSYCSIIDGSDRTWKS